jgi:hypothetical protein
VAFEPDDLARGEQGSVVEALVGRAQAGDREDGRAEHRRGQAAQRLNRQAQAPRASAADCMASARPSRLAAMGLLTFSINVTLDGCVDHQEGIADDETHAFFTRLMDEGGAMLWGRITYEMMESYWPAVARGDEEAPLAMREWAVKLEAKPKYVVSSTERAAQHATARAGLGEAAPQRRGRHALPARALTQRSYAPHFAA